MRTPLLLALAALMAAGCATPDDGSGSPVYLSDTLPLAPGPITLDRIIDAEEWAGARTIEGTFRIADGSPRDGEYPFALHLMADRMNVYVAVQVWNLTPNEVLDPYRVRADHVTIYLSADNDTLSAPSDMIDVASVWEGGSRLIDGYWNGDRWVIQDDYEPGGDFNEGRPLAGRWARTGADRANLTQWWEFHIPRASTLTDYDGFRVPQAAPFRLAVGLTLEPTSAEAAGTPVDAHRDVYPGEGHTPEFATDPAQWLRLAVR